MNDDDMDDLKDRLAKLGAHIDSAVDDFHRQGVLHGPEREKAAEWKLQHLSLHQAASGQDKSPSELARDVEILKTSFERWLARIDKRSEA